MSKPHHDRNRRDGQRSHGSRSNDVPPIPENLPQFPNATSIVLRPGTATPVVVGHPWIFSGAIAHIVPPVEGQPVEAGSPCAVFDQHGRYIGYGSFNPHSQIAVRMLELGLGGLEPSALPEPAALVAHKLASAADLRLQVGLPSGENTAWRLVNSEGDGLPGLTIDRYAQGAVVAVTTAAMWRWLPLIESQLLEKHGCSWLLVRVPTDVHVSEQLIPGHQHSQGQVPQEVAVLHNGLRLRVDPSGGQKTGMYLDQRDNHRLVGQLAAGRFVLDAFSHAGGFGLHAARQGAKRVLCVDASQKAIDLAILHAEDNGLPQLTVQCADAVHVLAHHAELPETEKPSLVIIDPPKFATKAAALEQAIKKYTSVNAVAMRAVASGGLLLSCSCSGLVDRQAFLRMLATAALQAGKVVQLLDFRGPAPDHPVAPAHAEGQYLKVALLRVTAREG